MHNNLYILWERFGSCIERCKPNSLGITIAGKKNAELSITVHSNRKFIEINFYIEQIVYKSIKKVNSMKEKIVLQWKLKNPGRREKPKLFWSQVEVRIRTIGRIFFISALISRSGGLRPLHTSQGALPPSWLLAFIGVQLFLWEKVILHYITLKILSGIFSEHWSSTHLGPTLSVSERKSWKNYSKLDNCNREPIGGVKSSWSTVRAHCTNHWTNPLFHICSLSASDILKRVSASLSIMMLETSALTFRAEYFRKCMKNTTEMHIFVISSSRSIVYIKTIEIGDKK